MTYEAVKKHLPYRYSNFTHEDQYYSITLCKFFLFILFRNRVNYLWAFHFFFVFSVLCQILNAFVFFCFLFFNRHKCIFLVFVCHNHFLCLRFKLLLKDLFVLRAHIHHVQFREKWQLVVSVVTFYRTHV